jgi:hypothetical protein
MIFWNRFSALLFVLEAERISKLIIVNGIDFVLEFVSYRLHTKSLHFLSLILFYV